MTKLLKPNSEVTIHQRSLQVLMVEVFKLINGFAPPIMENFLLFSENTHNFRSFQIIFNETKKIRYGLEMVKYKTLLL